MYDWQSCLSAFDAHHQVSRASLVRFCEYRQHRIFRYQVINLFDQNFRATQSTWMKERIPTRRQVSATSTPNSSLIPDRNEAIIDVNGPVEPDTSGAATCSWELIEDHKSLLSESQSVDLTLIVATTGITRQQEWQQRDLSPTDMRDYTMSKASRSWVRIQWIAFHMGYVSFKFPRLTYYMLLKR